MPQPEEQRLNSEIFKALKSHIDESLSQLESDKEKMKQSPVRGEKVESNNLMAGLGKALTKIREGINSQSPDALNNGWDDGWDDDDNNVNSKDDLNLQLAEASRKIEDILKSQKSHPAIILSEKIECLKKLQEAFRKIKEEQLKYLNRPSNNKIIEKLESDVNTILKTIKQSREMKPSEALNNLLNRRALEAVSSAQPVAPSIVGAQVAPGSIPPAPPPPPPPRGVAPEPSPVGAQVAPGSIPPAPPPPPPPRGVAPEPSPVGAQVTTGSIPPAPPPPPPPRGVAPEPSPVGAQVVSGANTRPAPPPPPPRGVAPEPSPVGAQVVSGANTRPAPPPPPPRGVAQQPATSKPVSPLVVESLKILRNEDFQDLLENLKRSMEEDDKRHKGLYSRTTLELHNQVIQQLQLGLNSLEHLVSVIGYINKGKLKEVDKSAQIQTATKAKAVLEDAIDKCKAFAGLGNQLEEIESGLKESAANLENGKTQSFVQRVGKTDPQEKNIGKLVSDLLIRSHIESTKGLERFMRQSLNPMNQINIKNGLYDLGQMLEINVEALKESFEKTQDNIKKHNEIIQKNKIKDLKDFSQVDKDTAKKMLSDDPNMVYRRAPESMKAESESMESIKRSNKYYDAAKESFFNRMEERVQEFGLIIAEKVGVSLEDCEKFFDDPKVKEAIRSQGEALYKNLEEEFKKSHEKKENRGFIASTVNKVCKFFSGSCKEFYELMLKEEHLKAQGKTFLESLNSIGEKISEEVRRSESQSLNQNQERIAEGFKNIGKRSFAQMANSNPYAERSK